MDTKAAQRFIREASPVHLRLYGLKEAVTVPDPARQKAVSRTSTNLSGAGKDQLPAAEESEALSVLQHTVESDRKEPNGSGRLNGDGSALPAQNLSTRPCSECSELTLESDLTDDGRGFKLCPKCFVPDEEQESDPFIQRAYDASNDRWIYE